MIFLPRYGIIDHNLEVVLNAATQTLVVEQEDAQRSQQVRVFERWTEYHSGAYHI